MGPAADRVVVGAGTIILAIGAVVIPAAISAGAAATNGDPTTLFGIPCVTLIPITLDISSQMVVPNVVNQGDSYTATFRRG